VDGHHALKCLSGPLRNQLHHDLRDIVANFASAAHLHVVTERAGFANGSSLRPDIWLNRTPKGRIAIDVAATHFATEQGLAWAAAQPAGAATAYDAIKRAKYDSAAKESSVEFAPIVFDTLGAPSASASETIAFIAKEWGKLWDFAPCRSIPIVFGQVNFVVMRGVARILGSFASPTGYHVSAAAPASTTSGDALQAQVV
jgi:hypothetical protein